MYQIKGNVSSGKTTELLETAVKFANEGTEVCILSVEYAPDYLAKRAVELGLKLSAGTSITAKLIVGDVWDVLPEVEQDVIFLDALYSNVTIAEEKSKLEDFEKSTGKTLYVTVQTQE